MPGYIVLYHHTITGDGNMLVCGTEYTHTGHRLRNLKFIVTHLPFVVHLGPYSTQIAAKRALVALKKYDDVLSNETGRTPLALTIRVKAATWKGVPYLCKPMARESRLVAAQSLPSSPPAATPSSDEYWVECVFETTDVRAFPYSDYYNKFKQFATNSIGTFFTTDRTHEDVDLRILAPYNLPGFFSSKGLNRIAYRDPVSLYKPFTVKWEHFHANILMSQVTDGFHRIENESFSLTDVARGLNLSASFVVALVEPNCKTATMCCVTFGNTEQDGGYTNESESGLLSTSIEIMYPIPTTNYNAIWNEADFVILAVEEGLFDQVHAKAIQQLSQYSGSKASSSSSKRGAATYLNPSTVNGSLRKAMLDLKIDIPDAIMGVNCSFSLPKPAGSDHTNWPHPKGLHYYLEDLFIKARVLGKGLISLSSPVHDSKCKAMLKRTRTVTKRVDALFTKILMRSNYTVLPSSNQEQSETSDDATDGTEYEPEQTSTFTVTPGHTTSISSETLAGGLNSTVHAQYVHDPYGIFEIDYSSYYGSIISIFGIDFCNEELWKAVQRYLRENPGKSDISVAIDQWYSKVKSDNGEILDYLSDPAILPITNYMRKCLKLRHRLVALPDGPEKEASKDMIAFLKELLSMAYGPVASEYSRFRNTWYSSAVTQIGRTIIVETSNTIKSFLPRGSSFDEIMCSTDALFFRYNRKMEEKVAKTIVERLKEHNERVYGRLLVFTTVYASHFSLTQTNHYCMITDDGKMTIRGYSPRQHMTPPICRMVIEAFVVNFLKTYTRNVWLDKLAAFPLITFEEHSKLSSAVNSSIKVAWNKIFSKYRDEARMEEELPFLSGPPAEHIDDSDYHAKYTISNANRSNVFYSKLPMNAHEAKLVEVNTTFNFIKGQVIEVSPRNGTIISLTRPVTTESWAKHYVDTGIRCAIVKMFEGLFPMQVVDEGLRDVLHLPAMKLNENRGASSNASNGKKKATALNGNYWEKIQVMAASNDVIRTESAQALSAAAISIPKVRDGEAVLFEWEFRRTCASCNNFSVHITKPSEAPINAYACAHCKNSIYGNVSKMIADYSSSDKGGKGDDQVRADEQGIDDVLLIQAKLTLVCYIVVNCERLVFKYNDVREYASGGEMLRNYKDLEKLRDQVLINCRNSTLLMDSEDDSETASSITMLGSHVAHYRNLYNRNSQCQPSINLQQLSLLQVALRDHPFNKHTGFKLSPGEDLSWIKDPSLWDMDDPIDSQ